MINDESSWSKEVINFLDQNGHVFRAFEEGRFEDAPAYLFDKTIKEFRAILSQSSLHGFHCTRLTQWEIEKIKTDGLAPQNGILLEKRIDLLFKNGEVSLTIADRLKSNNQADKKSRKGMIWFTFYSPQLDARGVSRFFEFWGGEALYNSHERDPETGEILRNIGLPCIIEADVPIRNDPHAFLESKLYRAYFKNRGINLSSDILHDGYSTNHIDAHNIAKIICWPSSEFNSLSGNWNPQ